MIHTGVSTVQEIKDQSQIGEARRVAQSMAISCGFDDTEAGKVGILVTEAATNILKHAKQGLLIFRKLAGANDSGIEMIAVDNGPGIANIGLSLRDGYSTAGSPGNGMGAMDRLSSFFDVYSLAGRGTVLAAQIWAKPQIASSAGHVLLGVICAPYPGEQKCGDNWAVEQTGGMVRLIVADGIGHGELAFEASDTAIKTFVMQRQSTVETMHTLHGALAQTRGAAASISEIDSENRVLRFAGVGNVSGMILTGTQARGLASYNGTLGYRLLKVQELQYPWPVESLLIMHSDGLNTRWKLEDYPGLSHRHPSLIAGMLYRDAMRGRDDVTILVIKDNP